MKTLVLYSRSGCHLCERLAEDLAPVLSGRARLDIVDIDGDLALKKRFGLRIPVLASAEGELSGYPLDSAAVEAFLAATEP